MSGLILLAKFCARIRTVPSNPRRNGSLILSMQRVLRPIGMEVFRSLSIFNCRFLKGQLFRIPRVIVVFRFFARLSLTGWVFYFWEL